MAVLGGGVEDTTKGCTRQEPGGAGAFESVWKTADIIATIGVIPLLVWMVAMGLSLVRLPEPTTA